LDVQTIDALTALPMVACFAGLTRISLQGITAQQGLYSAFLQPNPDSDKRAFA
jgi:hypothetical protein